jgi:hypothetical protein
MPEKQLTQLLTWSVLLLSDVGFALTWNTIRLLPCADLIALESSSDEISKFSVPYSISAAFLPEYHSQFRMEQVQNFLQASGYRSKTSPVSPQYQEPFNAMFHQESPAILEALKSYGVKFVVPEGFRFVSILGAGEKGLFIGLERETSGEAFAVKLPLSKKGGNERADLALNLELEMALNSFLRQNYAKYRLNTIPVVAYGQFGTYMATKRFPAEQGLGHNLDKIISANLSNEQANQYRAALEKSDVSTVGQTVRDVLLQNSPKSLIQELQQAFYGAQNLAKETGLNIDFVSDNLVILDGKVVLFDTGIRTSPGLRAQKYTLGENFAGNESDRLSFEGWLEIMHINWLVNSGQMIRATP